MIVLEETGLKCAVPGRTLLQILADAEAEVDVKQEKNEIVITDGSGVVNLPIMNASAFVFEIPDLDVGLEVELSETLVGGLDFVATCSSAETIRPELMGVTFLLQAGVLGFYSTDNLTITRFITEVESTETRVCIIPKSSAELLSKVYRDLKDDLVSAVLLISDKFVIGQYVVKDDKAPVVVVCKVIAAKPADYEGILAKHADKLEYVDIPDGLEQMLRRAVTVTAGELKNRATVQLLDTGFFTMEAKGPMGRVEGRLPVKATKGKAVPNTPEIVINPGHILRALSHLTELAIGKDAMMLRGEAEGFVIEQAVARVSD